MILAAGAGRRIGSLGRRYPKALLPVLDRPLLAWQLEAVSRLGIRHVVVVVGHEGRQIVDALGDGRSHGVDVTFTRQDEPQGIAHALACAEDAVRQPFLLLLGDIFFAPEDLRGLFARFREPGTDGVLAVRHEEDPERIRRNYCVEADADGRVARVVEKPERPASPWKGTGLYAFGLGVFDAIRRTGRSDLRGEYELTDAIQTFVEDGAHVRTFVSRGFDFNVSNRSDLLDLNLHALASEGHDSFVAADAEVEGARLERSVVLTGASLEPGARLEECLVFAGERVPAGAYRRAIFAGGVVLGER